MSDDRLGPPGSGAAGFRVGHVIRRSLSILMRRFLLFYLLAVVPAFMPYLLHLLEIPQWTVQIFHLGELTLVQLNLWSVFTLLLSLSGSALGFAAVVYGAITHLRRGSVDVVECAVQGAVRTLPVLAIVLLIGPFVVPVMGSVVVLYPAPTFLTYVSPLTDAIGIGLGVACWVAIPAAVVERIGFAAAIYRSLDLAAGLRWRIAGIVAIVLVAVISISTAVLGPLSDWVEADVTVEKMIIFDAVGRLIDGLVCVFWGVVMAVSYHDLRLAKEGSDAAQMTAVFD